MQTNRRVHHQEMTPRGYGPAKPGEQWPAHSQTVHARYPRTNCGEHRLVAFKDEMAEAACRFFARYVPVAAESFSAASK